MLKVGDRVVLTPETRGVQFGRLLDLVWPQVITRVESDWLFVQGCPEHAWLQTRFLPAPAEAPAEASANEHAQRKARPMARGLLAYFPDALAEVANVSRVGNEQHHPGRPLHWEKDKSTDHADCLIRHQTDVGTPDTDGLSHTAKVAWRALAQLQTELEARNPALAAKRQAQRDKAANGER